MLICIGGIHGNEPAGVEATRHVHNLLSAESATNPQFAFDGTFLGLRGNLCALKAHTRYIEHDLNRSLTRDNVARILNTPKSDLRNEDLEIFELITTIREEIQMRNPERVVVLDLHTTSTGGGIFVLTSRDHESIRIGTAMNAPVITGFADNVTGTTMEYFQPENFDVDITTVVFEGGQHQDRLSVNRIIAAIINCLGNLGCIDLKNVENRFNDLLVEYSEGLPKVSRLVFRYHVDDGSRFQMLPNHLNYMRVEAGQVLAYDNHKPVKTPYSGMLIMPKYQDQGTDGFFIVEPLSGY